MSERQLTAVEWAEGRKLSVPPEVVLDIVQQIVDRDGKCRAAALVAEARSVDSPIHDYFEWEDTLAAQKYREVQARTLIARLRVVYQKTNTPVPAFVSVERDPDVDEPRGGYLDVKTAMTHDDTKEKVLWSALSELEAVRRRYGALQELDEVWSKVKQISTKVRRQRRRKAA